MANQAVRRLHLDLRRIAADPPEGCHACPKGSDIYIWEGMIYGPIDTPFEGGVFEIDLVFDDSYPLVPPKCKFRTPLFHPNVYPDGQVCVDILGNRWMPSYGVAALLVSLQSLLALPGTHDRTEAAANPEAERLYVTDRHRYDRHVMAMVDQQMLQGGEAEAGEAATAAADGDDAGEAVDAAVALLAPRSVVSTVEPGARAPGWPDASSREVEIPPPPQLPQAAARCHRAPRQLGRHPVPTFGGFCLGFNCNC